MLVKEAVGKFLVAARQAGKSDTTLRQYRWHLERMAGWLAEYRGEQLSEVSRALLRQWGAELRDQWSSATIKQAVCAARAFFSWCLEEGLVETDPGRALKVPRVKDRIQRTLTADEVQALWMRVTARR